jgi:phage-related protein
MKAKLEDSVATLGQKYGPALQIAGTAITAFGSIMTVISPLIAAGEMSWLWPVLLVIAGIAALGLAIYVIYRNWDTIWKAMQKIISDVWDWIKNNWPLLVGILFGPIGLAVALIIQNFGLVQQVVAACVSFIVGLWNGLLGFFRGLVGAIGAVLAGIWGGVTGAASSAVGTITGYWNNLVSFISGLPGRITSAASGMWNGLYTAFTSVVNDIGSAWNNTVGKLHFDIPGWVPGIGGHGFDAPTIPHLAQGGLITSTGFVYAHAGEAITPFSGRTGPVVQIDHAEFSSGLDVDTFMARVAWTARTAGV